MITKMTMKETQKTIYKSKWERGKMRTLEIKLWRSPQGKTIQRPRQFVEVIGQLERYGRDIAAIQEGNDQ